MMECKATYVYWLETSNQVEACHMVEWGCV